MSGKREWGDYLAFKTPGQIISLIILVVWLAGCVTGPDAEDNKPIFYPALPNAPRLQYLATFSSAKDLGTNQSAFARFIAGKETSEQDILRKPYGVAVHDGKLLVVDTRRPGYVVFDLANKKYRLVRGSGNGRMRKPINISLDSDGNRYITDTGRKQILVFNKLDKYVKAYGVKDQFNPSDVALSGNRLYVADIKHHKIQVLSKQSGKTIRSFGKVGSKDGEFYYPTNLALDSKKQLYVSDTGNYRIQKFTLDGKWMGSFGGVGTALGKFARPKGVAVDKEGRAYVVDAGFENVQIFDLNQRLLLFFGAAGDDRDSINLPADIFIDYENAALFQKYADPDFRVEYVVLVSSQFGINKVNAYGFGRLKDIQYQGNNKVRRE